MSEGSNEAPPATLGVVLFPGFTALDAVGPLEVFARTKTRCFVVAHARAPVASDRGLRILPDYEFTECPPIDALFVPGGPGQTPAMDDEALIRFLRQRSAHARWTISVCTGALLLARAGVLQGRPATTHWLAMEELGRLGAIPTRERVVFSPPVVTGAGVSAGIDLALVLVARWYGDAEAQRIQLATEYDPAPPFDCGAPDRAPAALVESLKATSRFHGRRRPPKLP